MKKFNFRLSGALRVRETQLEAERVRLHRLFNEKQQLENSLRALADSRVEATTFVQQAPELVNTDLRALSAFMIGTQYRSSAIQDAMNRLDARIREQQRKVTDAERKVRLLEKVRERKLIEWQAQADHELEIIAEEAWNSARYSSKRKLIGEVP
jgi:flagellar export protein FliJ